MLRIRKILFPVDFSERCSAAAPHVTAMAAHFEAKLVILNALSLPPVLSGGIVTPELEPPLVDAKALLADRQRALDSYLQNQFEPLPDVERIVQQGEPGSVITGYARKNNVDLIMMPTHGYGPFRGLLLGSTAAKVLHDAECPVWADRHEATTFTRSDCKEVLCAVDLRDESAPVIQWAGQLAASYSARLTLVHVIPAIAAHSPLEESGFPHYLAEQAREFIDELQRTAGTEASVRIEGGKIAHTVREVASQNRADVVVIGQGCLHETMGRLRSNAYAIIRESPCPVVRV